MIYSVRVKKDEKANKKKNKSKGKKLAGTASNNKAGNGLAPTMSVNPLGPAMSVLQPPIQGVKTDGLTIANSNTKNIEKLKGNLPKEKSKKKAKLLGQIDVFGQQFQAATLIEGYSFFQDLNFGDMALVFNNPFFDFQYKERQDIEMYQFNHLKELRDATMAKLNYTAKQTKKMEADNIKNIQNIKEKFKKLVETESKLNIRIDLQEAYDFYSKFINLKPENQIESRKDEKYQKQAFANALIYFSDRYYVNDMSRVKVGKQPYSDCSSQSLRDFLFDTIFEFNIFHKIAKRKFYTKKDGQGNSVLGDTQENNPLGHQIEHKLKKKPNLIEQTLSKNQKKEAFTQVFSEETNYFFVKRPDNMKDDANQFKEKDDGKKTFKEIATDQYKAYLELTVKLNDASLHYYKDYINKKEIRANNDDESAKEPTKMQPAEGDAQAQSSFSKYSCSPL